MGQRISRKSRAHAPPGVPLGNEVVTFCYGDQKAVLARPAIYKRAVSAARNHFNISGDITLGTMLEGSTEVYEISPEAWRVMSLSFRVVLVWVDTDCEGVDGPGISDARIGSPRCSGEMSGKGLDNMITLTITALTGRVDTLSIRGSDPISTLFDNYSSLLGVPKDLIRLIYAGRQLEQDGMTVHEAGLTDGSMLHFVIRIGGKKPVIYLYPPTPMDVSVKLSLIPTWEYSAVYPLTVIKEVELAKGQVGQYIEWNVHANPSGLLQDKVSGKDITYLFWEAETCATPSQLLSTPPSSRSNSPSLNSRLAKSLAFDPTSPQVTPDESILLPAHKIPYYLDDALTVLGLHTEARTSFITYWLPSIMKHPHVALRFLPQEAYEAAAPMEVMPLPDVVTRIFMVARGIDNEEAQRSEWAEASLRASQPVEIWQGIVGMCLESALDSTVFRVLEWGGMFMN